MNKPTPVLLMLFIFLVRQASGAEEPGKRELDVVVPTMEQVKAAVVRNNNQFALELHRQLASRSKDGNTVCSPNSVSNALGMLYLGARGKTAEEMAATLHFDVPAAELGKFLSLADPTRNRPLFRLGVTVVENKGNGVQVSQVVPDGPGAAAGIRAGDVLLAIDNHKLRTELDFQRTIDYSTGRIDLKKYDAATKTEVAVSVTMTADVDQPSPGQDLNAEYLRLANAIWIQKDYDVRPEYIDLLSKTFHASAEQVDFQKATDASIAKINAWVAAKTDDAIKELVTRDSVDATARLVVTNAVSFKGLWSQEFDSGKTADGEFIGLDGKALSVPVMRAARNLKYANTDELQAVEIPYRDSTLTMVILLPTLEQGLAAMENSLSAKKLETLLTSLKSTQVDLRLPRFSISTDAPLKEVLGSMGIRSALNAGAADFSGITSQGELFLSAVLHQARIKVDEAGTTASAATAGVGVPRGGFSVPFHVDHPFVFLLRDSISDSIVFVGRVVRP